MGGQCCVSRKDKIELSPHILTFDPKKNGLAIAFSNLLEDSCEGMSHKLDLLYELSQRYAYNHECCFLDPDYLSEKFNLIEFQSLGRKCQPGAGLSHAFDKELQYLLDEGIIIDEDNFSVIILIMFGTKLHPFSLKKRTLDGGKVQYIVHDIFPSSTQSTSKTTQSDRSFKGVICKEIVFESMQKLHQYLNTISIYYFSQSPTFFTQKIQLLTFQVSDEKSFTCSESDFSFLNNDNDFDEIIEQDLPSLTNGGFSKKISKAQRSIKKSSQILSQLVEKGKKKSGVQIHEAYMKEQQTLTTMNTSIDTDNVLRTTQDTISSKFINC